MFEYVCSGCGREFELLVSSGDKKVACPKCGGKRVVKKFSVFGSKSGGKFTPSQGGGCSSCSKSSCSSCR